MDTNKEHGGTSDYVTQYLAFIDRYGDTSPVRIMTDDELNMIDETIDADMWEEAISDQSILPPF